MQKYRIIVPILAGCALLTMPTRSLAFRGIMTDWQAHYTPCQTLIDADCNACHENGFDYNFYGEDLKIRIGDLNMSNTEAFIDAENVDSDGDTYSNGQEIVVDCTLPWDDSDHGTVPADDTAWSEVKALFR